MKHAMYGTVRMLPLFMVLLLYLFTTGAAQGSVFAPLQADIQAPEDGFTIGAEAELLLTVLLPAVGENHAASLELTLTASGVAQLSGQRTWTIDKPTAGEMQRVTAVAWLSGDGEGEWRLDVSSFNADGQRMWGASATLFVLQARSEVLFGKSSGFHLLQERLEKDREKGTLSEEAFNQEQQKLLRGEELNLQKELKGNAGEEAAPQTSVKAVVNETYVSGSISYTHRTGRNAGVNEFSSEEDARPLASMLIEFYDIDDASETKLVTIPAEVRTNETGDYTNVRVPGKRANDTAVNLEVRFIFDSPAATIRPAVAGDVSYVAALIVTVNAANMTVNRVIDSTSMDNLRRAHIHEAALFCYNETRSLITKTGIGVNPEKIIVHFPGPSNNGSYFWTVGGNHIAIGLNHAFDWDVFTHEYGHYIQELNDTARNPGGQHFIDGNLSGFQQRNDAGNVIRTLTKEQGIQMAWAEGWPTYYGTFLQIAGGAAEFNIYTAGDLVYTDTGNNFSYDLEDNTNLIRGNGEDVELAVQRILWDFADAPQDENDEVVFGHERLWVLLHSDPKPLTLNAFRSKMNDEIPPMGNLSYSAGTLEQNRVRYGAVYHDHNVGPAPLTPEAGHTSGVPPRFTWHRRGAGANPSYRFNRFNVQFYDKDFQNIIFTSPEIPTTAGALTNATTAEWTPTQAQWDEIMEHGDVLHWGVLGSHNGAPATGPYLGLTRLVGGPSISFVIDNTGSMGREIAGVRQGLTLFIDMLRWLDLEVNPLIEVITFWDHVEHDIVSRDLDEVQAVVDAMGAWGGGDCPEASAQALNAAVKNLAPGGVVIFATDASPHKGYDLAGIKAAARAKGIIINQFVTSDCVPSSPDGFKSVDDLGVSSCNPGYDPEPESLQPVEWWSDVFCLDCPEDDSAGPPMTPNILKLVGDWTLPPVSAVAAFTDLASASPKGHFLYMPGVKMRDGEPFANAIANTALAAVVPTVLALQPSDGQQGTTMDVIVAGGRTNFRDNSVVAFSDSGITINSMVALSETEIIANITIDAEAEIGFRDVSVTTPLGVATTEEAGGSGQFRVIAATGIPSLISVVPRTIAQGTTSTLIISGANTHFLDGVTQVIFGTGIATDSVSVLSPARLQVDITVDADAPVGFRRITVETDAETLNLTNTLTLVETLGVAAGVPAVESVSPNELPRGEADLDLIVIGKNTSFEDGETVATFSGTGISVESLTVNSAIEATLRVTVDADASLGARDIIMSTGGQTAVRSPGVTVIDALVDEGEDEGEGEAEGEPEGEGEQPEGEGEDEGEGELPEGEGEQPEGEGEDEGEDAPGGCCRSCSAGDDLAENVKRLFGDYLLVGVSLLTLLMLTAYKKRS